MESNTINERIQQIVDELFNGNKAAFAKAIGKAPTTVANILGARKTTPSSDFVESIKNSIENINLLWLMTGVGEMLIADDTLAQAQELKAGQPEETGYVSEAPGPYACKKGVPYYENIEGTCSIVAQFNDYPETPTFFINYEHFNDCTAYIPVVGDSMYPQYCSGEIIAVKRIYNLDVIQWGEAYFVVTNENANSLRTVKQVHWSEDPDKIILRASNPNFKGDTVINKSDVISMFIIKGNIKRNQL